MKAMCFAIIKRLGRFVADIKKGLQKEGMDDIADCIRTERKGDLPQKTTAKRNPKFKDTKIFLPRVLCKGKSGLWRNIIYSHDILQEIDFSQISYSKKSSWTPENRDFLKVSAVKVDIEGGGGGRGWPYARQTERKEIEGLGYSFLIKRLCHFIPNPWDAGRIFDETISALKAKGISDQKIYLSRAHLLESMEEDITRQIDALGEKIFKDKLKSGSLCFKIFKRHIDINWEMGYEMDFIVSSGDKALKREDGGDFQRSLFDAADPRHYNELEKQAAWYLDDKEAVKWWHRLIARQGYHLQGWQRRKVYPDFLAFISPDNKIKKLAVLETKGDHLKGNDDTNYKRKLFQVLERHAADKSLNVGDMEVVSEKEQKMIFKILMEKTWREDLGQLISSP